MHWEKILPPWFRVLSATATPDEYGQRIVSLLKHHYSSATKKTPLPIDLALSREIDDYAKAHGITRCAAGATRIDVDASLAAVEFYKANGFEELGRGEHRLSSGRSMACVFMRKRLS